MNKQDSDPERFVMDENAIEFVSDEVEQSHEAEPNDRVSEEPAVIDLDHSQTNRDDSDAQEIAQSLRRSAERVLEGIPETLSKDLGMDVDVFRIVTTEDIADEYDSNLLAVGVDFPNHDVFVDWRVESWPDGQELGGPHVSVYSSLEDLAQVTQGEIEPVETVSPEEDLIENLRKRDVNWQQLDEVLLETYKSQVWREEFEKSMWENSDEVPEFVQRWVSDVVERVDPMWDQGYENVPKAAALRLHKEITESLTQPQGWSVNSIVRRLTSEFEGLDVERARNITRSEVAAVLNKAREVAYRARPDEVQVKWVGPDDEDTTVICEHVKSRIAEVGGAVTVFKLREILDETAREHRGSGGTPERAKEYVPHYQCRHTMVEI